MAVMAQHEKSSQDAAEAQHASSPRSGDAEKDLETPIDDASPAERSQSSQSLHKIPSLQQAVSLPREVLVVALICLAQFMTQVALGQVLSILHVIGDDFGITDAGVLSWLIAGYSLTVGTFILLAGRLGDIYGYKRMLVIGYVWFALWSFVSGLSVYSNYVLFIFSRVLTGIGPAMCLPNAVALLGIMYEPGKRKNMAFSMFGACAPGGSIVGSAFAALFALAWWPCESLWACLAWEWLLTHSGTFWATAITLAMIAVTAAMVIPDNQIRPEPPQTMKALADDLDLIAAATGITALILFNFAWNQAPIAGWNSPYVIVCLLLGLLLFPTFFYLELRVSPSPLIPFSVLNSTNAFVLGCIACGWANFGIWAYYFWQILEVLRGASPLLASAYLSPLIIAGIIAATMTGVLLSRIRAAWVMVIAMTAFLVGNILIATVPPHQIYWGQFFVCACIAPLGMDMSFPAATIYLSNSIEKERQGVAASLVNTYVEKLSMTCRETTY